MSKSKSLTNPKFDYSKLTKDEAGKLKYFSAQLIGSRKRVADEMIMHGEILHGAQQLLANNRNGVFGEWVESYGISKRSAYNAIDVFVAFGSYRANLHDIEISAMYVLAKHPEAKDKALKLVSKGVKVTHAMALELIESTRGDGASGGKQKPDSSSLPPTSVKSETVQPPPNSDPLDDARFDQDPYDPDEFDEGEDDSTEAQVTDATEETAPRPPRNGKDKPGEDASIVLDALDRPVPEKFRDAHGLAAEIQTEGRKLDAILRKLKELRDKPGGDFIDSSGLDIMVQSMKGEIFGACYWSECPKCKGKGKKCADCQNTGWWPKAKKGHLSTADKKWLGVS